MPGRWADARQPSAPELNATAVVVMPIDSASAKVRTGPPVDDEEDYALPVWAGVVPFGPRLGTPEADARLRDGIGVPDYVEANRSRVNRTNRAGS